MNRWATLIASLRDADAAGFASSVGSPACRAPTHAGEPRAQRAPLPGMPLRTRRRPNLTRIRLRNDLHPREHDRELHTAPIGEAVAELRGVDRLPLRRRLLERDPVQQGVALRQRLVGARRLAGDLRD